MSASLPPSVVPVPVPAAHPLAPAEAWRLAWTCPTTRRSWLLLLVLMFGGLLPLVPGFFHYIQQRPGTMLPDPLLGLFPCQDHATLIFVLMYGSVVVGVGWLLAHPALFLRGMWALLLLLLMRLTTIWLLPLAPPALLLPMPDPFLAHLFQTTGSEVITKDLFFSGHTSTVALLALAVRGRGWRWVLWLTTIAVGVLVLVQRVHYSYDVLAAPLFAWLAYWLGGKLVSNKLNADMLTA